MESTWVGRAAATDPHGPTPRPTTVAGNMLRQNTRSCPLHHLVHARMAQSNPTSQLTNPRSSGLYHEKVSSKAHRPPPLPRRAAAAPGSHLLLIIVTSKEILSLASQRDKMKVTPMRPYEFSIRPHEAAMDPHVVNFIEKPTPNATL